MNVSACEHISPSLVTFTNINMIAPYRLVHTDLHIYVCVQDRDFFVDADHGCIGCR